MTRRPKILIGSELDAQRAAILALLPRAEVVRDADGNPEPRHGALSRLATRAGCTRAFVLSAWKGRRVSAAVLEKWANVSKGD